MTTYQKYNGHPFDQDMYDWFCKHEGWVEVNHHDEGVEDTIHEYFFGSIPEGDDAAWIERFHKLNDLELDHTQFFKRKDKDEYIIVGHLYDIDYSHHHERSIADLLQNSIDRKKHILEDTAKVPEVSVEFPFYPSWYNPVYTTLVIYRKKNNNE